VNRPKTRSWLAACPLLLSGGLGVAISIVGSEQALNCVFPAAVAAEDGHAGGHSGGHSGGGQSGGHSGGHAGGRRGGHDGGHEDDGHTGHTPGPKGYGSHGSHRGGHGHEVARGGGKAVENQIFRGRRPIWAQEGIPQVEMGRLNVSRAPGHVLARAEAEALANYSAQMAALYNLPADEAAQLLQAHFREVERYDSPLQNLALYKDVMTFGDTQLPGVEPVSQIDLAAIFLGSASDKNIPVTEDTVTAVNRILGLVELSPDDRAALASKAEQVRDAILTGHGEAGH
jgi:hypothetical protein